LNLSAPSCSPMPSPSPHSLHVIHVSTHEIWISKFELYRALRMAPHSSRVHGQMVPRIFSSSFDSGCSELEELPSMETLVSLEVLRADRCVSWRAYGDSHTCQSWGGPRPLLRVRGQIIKGFFLCTNAYVFQVQKGGESVWSRVTKAESKTGAAADHQKKTSSHAKISPSTKRNIRRWMRWKLIFFMFFSFVSVWFSSSIGSERPSFCGMR
jgi:hypothetical protein